MRMEEGTFEFAPGLLKAAGGACFQKPLQWMLISSAPKSVHGGLDGRT